MAQAWAIVRSDKLADKHKNIPLGSVIYGLRESVAGTDEAEQTVLDTQLLQTTAIKKA